MSRASQVVLTRKAWKFSTKKCYFYSLVTKHRAGVSFLLVSGIMNRCNQTNPSTDWRDNGSDLSNAPKEIQRVSENLKFWHIPRKVLKRWRGPWIDFHARQKMKWKWILPSIHNIVAGFCSSSGKQVAKGKLVLIRQGLVCQELVR